MPRRYRAPAAAKVQYAFLKMGAMAMGAVYRTATLPSTDGELSNMVG